MMKSFIFIFTIILWMVPPLPQINGYTHWSVTPNGMIVPITTSFFHLRQPWNLFILFQQENNRDFVQSVDLKLNQMSEDLKFNQKYQNNVHKFYIDSNSACVKATKLLSEFDLHSTHILTLETKGIQSQMFLNESNVRISKNQFKEPFCDVFFNRTFSPCCFDHLESIKNRSNHQGIPELLLYKVALPQHLTPSEYGHLVFLSLAEHYRKPSSNWILYNMAAFYWRVKGSAKNAINCLRAALHTSPNRYLDVALVSLANVFHLIKSTSKDAVILMENAILISPYFSSHHLILGNIFASLGQFNSSLYHFEMAVKLHRTDKDQTKLKDIKDRLFAARCSYELSLAISNQQSNLNKQLKELDKFQYKTEQYHDANISIELEMVNNITQIKRQKMYEICMNDEKNKIAFFEQCIKFDPISNQPVVCEPVERNLIFTLFQNVNHSFPEETSVQREKVEIYKPTYQRQYKRIFPNDKDITDDLDEIKKVPCSSLNCYNLEKDKSNERFMSINLSPRNKGFELINILTKDQGLEDDEEHSLPWHPPYCMLYIDKDRLPSLEAVDNLPVMKKLNIMKYNAEEYPRIADQRLYRELKKLVNNSEISLEDIGQRIVTALTTNLTPVWIILNIAGLYWRVMGNLLQAIDCQQLSVKLSPLEYRDISMVNLAGILLRLNQTQDALKLTKLALKIDYSEPETHLLAAVLFQYFENYNLAYKHFDIAIKQEPRLDLASEEKNFAQCQLCSKQRKNIQTEDVVSENEESDIVSNLFLKYKMCISIRECRNIISNNGHHLPHIKITIKGQSFSHTDINGASGSSESILADDNLVSQIMYGFLWNTNVTNLYILEHDCVVLNDSIRTTGCRRNDEIDQASHNAVKFLEELKSVIQHLTETFYRNIKRESEIKNQIRHVDQTEKLMDYDELQSSSKLTSLNLHDEILKLISTKVVISPLAPEDCENVAPFDFKTYTPLYVSLNTMHVNIVSFLDSFTPSYSFSFSQQPYCSPKGNNIFLQKILDKYQVNFDDSPQSKVPEYNLHVSFLKTFEDKYTLEEIGKRLYTGLEQNASDWRLATVIVNYWRVYGDAKEAFQCLQVASETSPDFHLKVILVNAANILYRINKLEAALEISYRALKCPDCHKWVVIPFLVANIFATMDQWQKATLFYESCLSIKPNFDEATYRIKSIQCQQMMLKNLEQH